MAIRWIQLPPQHVINIIFFIYAFLLTISVWIIILKKCYPQKNYCALMSRIKTFWIIVAMLSLSLIVNKMIAIIFWGIVSYLALKEYFTIVPTRHVDRRVLFWAYISIPLQYYWIASGWHHMFMIFIPAYVFLFLPFRMILLGETKGFLRSAATVHWGVMMMVFCMSYLAAFYMIDPDKNPAGGAPGFILCLLFLNQLNDAAQFFWGKNCGKHKIIPSISPNKTVEGLIGGAATTIFFSMLIAPYLTPVSIQVAFFLGFLIALAGFVGDVIMSALKRDLGIKDTGQILPGHGGILDRIDSLLFTTPLYFNFIRFMY